MGIDVADIGRFTRTMERTPAMAKRLFTPAERRPRPGHPRGMASLAARFAAKEAVAKALGAPRGLRWLDAEITTGVDGRPHLVVSGTVAERARELGVRAWHVSLSHDAGIASAMVVAEG